MNCTQAGCTIGLAVQEVSVIVAKVEQAPGRFDISRFAVWFAHVLFLYLKTKNLLNFLANFFYRINELLLAILKSARSILRLKMMIRLQ